MGGSSLNGEAADDEGPEDKTADDLFQELADGESALGTRPDGDDLYDELSDESPEEIIAAADEEVEEHPVDDAILPDENALQDLLLEDRTEEDGFLWVDTGGAPETDDDPFEEDLIEKWSDAFAEASEETLTTDERATTDVEGAFGDVAWATDESQETVESGDASGPRYGSDTGDATDDSAADDQEPEITIEVPDPEDVAGATVDDEAASQSSDAASTANETEDGDLTDDDAELEWVTDAVAPTDPEETERSTEIDEHGTGETTDERSDEDGVATEAERDRIFDVEPDDEALASTVASDEDADDADEANDDEPPGLLSRVLSLLPF